tara:strand:+ start:160 stop:450 length:291 start_codon:yes stop_codon:yes gene_type:complete
MKININGKNCEINNSLRNYTNKKLQKLEAYSEIITSTNITFESDKINQIAEGHLHVHGTEIHAKAQHETMHGAMDGLIDKLVKQLVKYKEKNVERR